MKKITYLFAALLLVSSFASCKQEDRVYDGPAQLGFATEKMTIRALPNKTTYNLIYGLTNKSSVDVKCDIAVIKNTNPAGDRFHIITDLSKVVIPAGSTFGALDIYATNEAYNGGVIDTLKLAIHSAQATISYYDTVTVYVQQLCPIQNMNELEGSYTYYDESGFDPGLVCTITHVAGDTILVDIPLSSFTYLWGGPGSDIHPIKVLVNRSEAGYTTSVIEGQTWVTIPTYGRIVLYPYTNSGIVLTGDIDYCQDYLEVIFGMAIPDYLNGGYWFNNPMLVSFKRTGPLPQ